MAFEEIIAGPLSIYIGAVGATFPTLDAAPNGATWTLVGTNGDKNYSEEGVQVQHNANFNKVRTAGAFGPVKALMNDEDLMIQITLVDASADEYARALGNAAAATAAGSGTMGFKKFGLSRGKTVVPEFALLARGNSPELSSLPMQFCVPRCYNEGNPQPIFRRGEPARLQLMLSALEDPTASAAERFGYVQMGTAAALS